MKQACSDQHLAYKEMKQLLMGYKPLEKSDTKGANQLERFLRLMQVNKLNLPHNDLRPGNKEWLAKHSSMLKEGGVKELCLSDTSFQIAEPSSSHSAPISFFHPNRGSLSREQQERQKFSALNSIPDMVWSQKY